VRVWRNSRQLGLAASDDYGKPHDSLRKRQVTFELGQPISLEDGAYALRMTLAEAVLNIPEVAVI